MIIWSVEMFPKYTGDGSSDGYLCICVILHGWDCSFCIVTQFLVKTEKARDHLCFSLTSEIEVPSTLFVLVFLFMDLNDLMSAPPSIYLLEISQYSREKGSIKIAFREVKLKINVYKCCLKVALDFIWIFKKIILR